ncbi:MAG: AgmX/PglI C-terminal domain-containing protein [Bdellovibrionales bacterium]|nr:AgmX/PglI C-terminal domain-containing protein [Bdellovibrionales bacterium]
MGERQLVIENRLGQVVRTLNWDKDPIFLIHRHDTGRVEVLDSTQELESRGINFALLTQTSVEEIKKNPLRLNNGATLRFATSITETSPTYDLTKEDSGQFYRIMKRTAIGQGALLALILLLGGIVLPFFKTEELVVTIKPREKIEVPKAPVAVVEPARAKIQRKVFPKNLKARVVNRPVKRVVKTVTTKHTTRKPLKQVNTGRAVNVRRMGALGALGGTPSGFKGSRGLNLKSPAPGTGAGFSGVGGSGGLYQQVATSGLISAPVGSGKGEGAGGYGTRGKGGGRSGYGKMTMAGSSNGYSQPLSEEALIEGGLDRDQIAAVINRNLGQVIYCYEKGLQSEPKLSGRVAVRFTIDGNGRVKTAGLANSSLRDAKVEGCILTKLRGWAFPQPIGRVNVKVTYPFVLKRLSQG